VVEAYYIYSQLSLKLNLMEKTTRMSSSVLVWRIISGVVDGHVQTNNPSYDGAAALRLGA
jgi:hypothetical protein